MRFIEQTIDALRAHNPDILILLCRIIPIRNNQTVRMTLVDYLNRRIEEIASRKNRSSTRSRVVVVDQDQGFDATSGVDTYDGMHPNETGGRKMARTFYRAIQAHWPARVASETEASLRRANNHHRDSRFPAFWGLNDDWIPDQNHGGVLMKALQAMLLQPAPYSDRIHLLPAWPSDWDVAFKLHAPEQTTFARARRDGTIQSLRVVPASRRSDVVLYTPIPPHRGEDP